MKHQAIEAADSLRAVLARVISGERAKEEKAKPRRSFRAPGEASGNEALFVRIGILALYRADRFGRRQIVGLRFPGECILPHAGADYGIQAMTPSDIACIGDFDGMLAAHPELALIFWRLAQRNEAIAHEWLINCGRRNATERIAHLLCETAIRSGFGREEMLCPFTQIQMAEITGQTSVNVNRVLSDLEDKGLLGRKGSRF
jgi:CRP-like cAMP-binding protein